MSFVITYKTQLIFKSYCMHENHDENKKQKAMQSNIYSMHGGARAGGCDCDEQAHKGEVAHDIAVLAPKRAVAGAVAPGSRSTAPSGRPGARFGLSWEAGVVACHAVHNP